MKVGGIKLEYFAKESLYHLFLETLKMHHNKVHSVFDKVDLYPGQSHLLFILNKEDGKSQKELAKKLKIKPSTTTVMLGRMEKTGLIYRKQDLDDQRISRVYITDKGRDTCKDAIDIIRELEDDYFGNFTDEEEENFKRLLLKLKINLETRKKE